MLLSIRLEQSINRTVIMPGKHTCTTKNPRKSTDNIFSKIAKSKVNIENLNVFLISNNYKIKNLRLQLKPISKTIEYKEVNKNKMYKTATLKIIKHKMCMFIDQEN